MECTWALDAHCVRYVLRIVLMERPIAATGAGWDLPLVKACHIHQQALDLGCSGVCAALVPLQPLACNTESASLCRHHCAGQVKDERAAEVASCTDDGCASGKGEHTARAVPARAGRVLPAISIQDASNVHSGAELARASRTAGPCQVAAHQRLRSLAYRHVCCFFGPSVLLSPWQHRGPCFTVMHGISHAHANIAKPLFSIDSW